MKWQITVPQGTNKLQLDAELICRTHQMEQIRITGKNISCILISNRPLIEAIERPHPISISWRLFGGELKDEQLVSSIGKELEKNLSVKNQKNVELFTQMRKTA
jgi:hypothetical protein